MDDTAGTAPADDWDDATAWTISRPGAASASLGHHETLFTIGNGNLSLRGTFEEGRAGETIGCFMHRVWDDVEESTELACLPRWWHLDLWLDGRPVAMAASDGRQELDLRTGRYRREFRWPLPAELPSSSSANVYQTTDSANAHQSADSANVHQSAGLRVRHERFISLDDPHAAMLRTTVRADWRGPARARLRIQVAVGLADLPGRHWEAVDGSAGERGLRLIARTKATGIELAVAVRTRLSAAAFAVADESTPLGPATGYDLVLSGGEEIVLTRAVALVPGLDTPDPSGHAERLAARLDASGWETVLAASAKRWERLWRDCRLEIDGDPEAQQALRYNLFQLNIAAPRFTEDASIGAKTLSGYGYRHHAFWDTETFMLPVFTFTQPQVARNMLTYRCRRLDGARAKAAAGGHRGAQYPWESAATGREVAPTWAEHSGAGKPLRIWTGDIELHITADIAHAIATYWQVTGDDAFLEDQGAEVILEGARFWASRAEADPDGSYHYRDVIGPDEYHEHVDDNAYTNAMAAWHLRWADQLVDWLGEHAPAQAARLFRRLEIDQAERRRWRTVADNLAVPRHVDQVTEQFTGYFDRPDADTALLRDPERSASVQELLGPAECDQTQYVKQPDVLMLAHVLPEHFSQAELEAGVAYYDPRTDHEFGSSLGPAISAIVACRAGDAELGYQHFLRAARADLSDVRGNAGAGIHGASAGGLWQAVVFGFAGLRLDGDRWRTTPSLPPQWRALRFSFRHLGQVHTIYLRKEDLAAGKAAT